MYHNIYPYPLLPIPVNLSITFQSINALNSPIILPFNPFIVYKTLL